MTNKTLSASSLGEAAGGSGWVLSRQVLRLRSSLEEYQSGASKKLLSRCTVDATSGQVTKKQLPGTQPPALGRTKYIYVAVGALGSEVAPPQGIARLDCETGQTSSWMPDPREFCGEPMYAQRQGLENEEDGGYILSVLYNGKAEQSELVVLEASNIQAGPVARIPLGIAIPHGHFGCFTSDEKADVDAIERRVKLADKMESRGNRWNEVKSDFSGLSLRFDDMEEYFGDFFT